MQEMKSRYRYMLAVLLACVSPVALAAPPNAQAAKPIVKPAASQDSVIERTKAAKAKAKAGQSQGGKKAPLQSEDASKQPYRSLVDTVRKSTETFRDENVSESADRDRLPDPPGR
jgi:hypothetical protein